MTATAFLLTLLVTSAAPDLVVIEDWDSRPVRVTTAVRRPLLFVTRSGTRLKLEFVGSSGQHVVEHANGSTAAVVLHPGRHPFVIRFDDDHGGHVHGVVEALAVPPAREGAPTCNWAPPADICIEP